MYEMVTGKHPFRGQDASRALRVPPVNHLAADLPGFLVAAITFLMAWDVKDRPQTAAEVLDLLDDPRHGMHAIPRPAVTWAAEERLPLLLRLTGSNVTSISRATAALA